LRAQRFRESAATTPWISAFVALVLVAMATVTVAVSRSESGGALRSPAALRHYLRALRLINYFPSGDGWQYMWTRWQPAQLKADFGIMASMGANAVRVTVFPAVTGFPKPSPLMQSRITQIVGLAAAKGLKVQLSLFDQFTDFSDVSGSLTWAHDVLEHLAGSSEIAFIDLHNELDAPETMGRADVYHWIDALLPAVKSDADGIPVTLSVSHPQSIEAMRHALRVDPNFWDLHYYSPDSLAYVIMKEAVRAAAPLPVFVGETGFSTVGDTPTGLPSGEASMEAYQAHYYQVVEQASLSLGLGDAAPWDLYDFTAAAIPGHQQPDQYEFGLLRSDGSPKPAAEVIRRLFRTGKVSQDFNNEFSQGVNTANGVLPTVWRLWQTGQARFGWDPSVGYPGPGSARISDSAGADGSMPAFYTVPVQPQVTTGHWYNVTAWVRGLKTTGETVVNISWFNDVGTYVSGVNSASLSTGDPNWTELRAAGPAPPGAAFAEIWLKSAHNSGTVWFDDVTWEADLHQPSTAPRRHSLGRTQEFPSSRSKRTGAKRSKPPLG
jgi:hypothetical protein